MNYSKLSSTNLSDLIRDELPSTHYDITNKYFEGHSEWYEKLHFYHTRNRWNIIEIDDAYDGHIRRLGKHTLIRVLKSIKNNESLSFLIFG